jgi:hypothetical protein
MKNKQKEWHLATKPFFKEIRNRSAATIAGRPAKVRCLQQVGTEAAWTIAKAGTPAVRGTHTTVRKQARARLLTNEGLLVTN